MLQTLALLAAGAAGGVIGSAGGTASLVTYPALLAAGIPPLAANVTNSVAFLGNVPGAALAGRPEIRGRGGWLRRWTPLTAIGSALGAGLLLVTPASLFDRAAPFLIALAALTLLAQPRISAWLVGRPGAADQTSTTDQPTAADRKLALPAGLALSALYDGYWGAGAGIVTLTAVMIGTDLSFAQANALKNMLLGIADAACCTVFVLFWPVDWAAALPMAGGFVAGSLLGPGLTRRVPSSVARVATAVFGLGFAVSLWV